MSSGLAFGAVGRAGQRLKGAQAGIDIFQSGQRAEDYFERLGRETKRGSDVGSVLGGGLSLLGMAALSALSGGATLPLLGKMIIAGGATYAGSKVGAKRGAEKAGLGEFEEKFHRRAIRQGEADVRRGITSEAIGKGTSAAAMTALPGFAKLLKEPTSFLEFILQASGAKESGSKLLDPWFSNVRP